MKIKDIRNTYNIIVNSQAEHLQVITYLESLDENVKQLGYTSSWNKVCFSQGFGKWQLLPENYDSYKLPSINFNQLKDMLVEEEEWVPKIGDWIVCIAKGGSHKEGDITKITFFGEHNGVIKLMTPKLDKAWPEKTGYSYIKLFRKAEPHEIPKEEVLSEDSLIEEAKKRYPVGTKFYPAHTGKGSNEYCIVTDDSVFIGDNNMIYSKINGFIWSSDKDPKYGNTGYNRLIYQRGEWADIVVGEPIQYEVGKWYKYNDHIGKYLTYCNGTFEVSEYIYDKEYYTNNSRWGSVEEDHERELLTDLSEIQQYLPDGHVDKIQSSKFKVGVWYKNTEDGDYGKLCSEVTKDRFPCTEFISHSQYFNTGSYFAREWMDNLIEADLCEIQKYLPDGHPDKLGSSAYHVDLGDFNLPLPKAFSYESGGPVDTIINRAIMLSPSGIAYYFGSDPYKPDLDELKSSTIKLKTIEVRKLTTN